MPVDRPAWRERLKEQMEARAAELMMTWATVHRASGLAYETIRAARNERGDLRPSTRVRLENALRWAPGSINAIEAGGDATPAPAPGPAAVPVLPDWMNGTEAREARGPAAEIWQRLLDLARAGATAPTGRDVFGDQAPDDARAWDEWAAAGYTELERVGMIVAVRREVRRRGPARTRAG